MISWLLLIWMSVTTILPLTTLFEPKVFLPTCCGCRIFTHIDSGFCLHVCFTFGNVWFFRHFECSCRTLSFQSPTNTTRHALFIFKNITLHFISFGKMSLHYTTLHCITLHYITLYTCFVADICGFLFENIEPVVCLNIQTWFEQLFRILVCARRLPTHGYHESCSIVGIVAWFAFFQFGCFWKSRDAWPKQLLRRLWRFLCRGRCSTSWNWNVSGKWAVDAQDSAKLSEIHVLCCVWQPFQHANRLKSRLQVLFRP